jgi:glycosyltransferase involved in cell wall biosynthesis
MHLVLASVSAATSPSGVCRHAANIARGMMAFPSVRKVTMLTGEWQADYFRDAFNLEGERLEIVPVSIANRSASRNLWYLRTLPATARDRCADMMHLAYPMPLMRSAYSTPVTVSLHDLYPFDIPQNFGTHKAWLNRAVLRHCLKSVDAIACVSEPTRTRLYELFPALTPQKSSVIPNSIGVSSEAREIPLPDAIGPRPFLLCVAQHRANKNLSLLLRSFRLALDRKAIPRESKLVIVGNEGPETKRLHVVIVECDLQDRVLFLHGIPDTLLSTLYAKCELVIAPSLFEGFGLPVAEALAAGCRVVCSDIPAFRNATGSNCVFFDSADTNGNALVAAMRNAFSLRCGSQISEPGLQPRQAAAMYLALYAKLAQRNPIHALEPSPVDLSASGDL